MSEKRGGKKKTKEDGGGSGGGGGGGAPTLVSMQRRHFREVFALEKGVPADTLEDDIVERWYEMMLEPADPKVARYAKAVTRLLGEPANLGMAIQYKDEKSLGGSEAFRALLGLPSHREGEALRAQSWKALKFLSYLCFQVHDLEPPVIPTAAEIEANIKQFRANKQAKKCAPSGPAATASAMPKAFNEKLLAVVAMFPKEHSEATLSRIQKEDAAQACQKWCSQPFQGRDQPFGGGVFTADELAALKQLDMEDWKVLEPQLKQLNDLSNVQSSIPTNMLSQIESYASDLASKISSGETDFSALNLQNIGEDVLRNCSEEDIAGLAGNIGSLLPALGSLQASVQSESGGAALPSGMPDMAQLQGLATMMGGGAAR
tara:strand:+ start:123 stop:1247 length:1125 start_codon:yes stop_codon:yes gene_type:complete